MENRLGKNLVILSIFLVAGAAIAYEILAGSAMVNLLGASVYYFSLVIGIFLFALGIGGWLSAKIQKRLFERLIFIEIVLSFLGGSLSALIFGNYALVFNFLNKSIFSGINWFFGGLIIAKLFFSLSALFLIFAVGVLAGFELPLFSRLLAEKDDLKDALGKVFFWDYAGALLVSILTPIFFLSNFGIIRTSFLMGFVNALAALVLVVVLKIEKISIGNGLKIGVLFAIIFNLVGFLGGSRLELFFEKKLYGEREILYNFNSPYQRFSFVQSKDGAISLYINGQRQFESGEWDAVYHESFVHPVMNIAGKRSRILVLGGGDGLALREILKYPDVKEVTLVDIDEKLVAAAKDFEFMRILNQNSFRDPKVKVIIGDAFKFIEDINGREIYDIALVDFPDPSDDSLSRLYSKEFYRLLKNILKPDGLAVVQSSSYMDSVQQVILRTMSSAGFEVLAYHPPYFDLLDQNFGFTLASKKKLNKDEWLNKPVPVQNVIFNELTLGSILESKPIPRARISRSLEVNSLFRPTIFKAYGDVFIGHYLESRPKKSIIAQTGLSEEEFYKEFEKLIYKSPSSATKMP